MLLEQRWRNRETGTTDTGQYVQFYLSGVTHGNRQENLKWLFELTPEIRNNLTLGILQDDTFLVYAEEPTIVGVAPRRPLGIIPNNIADAIRTAIEKEYITSNEIVDVFDTMYNKEGVFSAILRLNYNDRVDHIKDKVFVLTGKMTDLKRAEAAAQVTEAGGRLQNSISKKINYLVIGDKGSPLYGDGDKGAKQVKVEGWIEEGVGIEVISETQFLTWLSGEAEEKEEPDLIGDLFEEKPKVDLSWLDPGKALEITL